MKFNTIGQLTLTLVFAALLFACNDDERNNDDPTGADDSSKPTQSLLERSLSGTWLYTIEQKYYFRSTDEYLFSSFIESTMIFNDNGQTVFNNRCSEYGHLPTSGIKTDKHLYLNVSDDPFSLSADNTLTRTKETLNPPYSPNHRIIEIYTLRQISTSIILDNGSLAIDGNLTHSEADHVCLLHTYNTLDEFEDTAIYIPYDDGTLTFGFRTSSRLAANTTYNYDIQSQRPSALGFVYLTSDASAFQGITDGVDTSADLATVTIDTASESNYSGTFSYTVIVPEIITDPMPDPLPDPAANDITFTGSFEIAPQF